ncbi:MAG: zinc ABC transporter substrate-binding protein [Clostridia bacterium]|jgi:zinc transport system substrate-binding protein|nr:zinc ABC transporter substrate-binding protein [Clostridia bacterium]MDD4275909.1 zinc ABC transporter substrate-binding protein [Clostridia bacterium]
MKKLFFNFVVVLLIFISAFSFTACNNTNTEDDLVIYASLYPYYDFASKIGGNKVTVYNLVQPGEEPHEFEPTTKQMAEINDKADLLILNGAGLESWSSGLTQNILNKTLTAATNVTTIEITSEGVSQIDPHIWLSISNAKIIMNDIKERLQSIDSENADYYQINYEKYSILFDGLNSEYIKAVESFTSTTFVVSHKAFGYIANEYNLTQLALSGLDSEGEADPATIANVIDYINANNIKIVFYHEFINSAIAAAVVNETEATLSVLNTLEGLTEEQISAGEDYLSIMAQNLIEFKIALN